MFSYRTDETTGEKWARNLVVLASPQQATTQNTGWPAKEFINNLRYESFPIISDFFIEIKNIDKRSSLYFKSKEHGIIGSFPWLNYSKGKLPQPLYGSFDKPFADIEQGWHIIIFRKEDYIYVIEGNDDDGFEHTLYYRVPVEIYESKWKDINNGSQH